MDDIAVEIDDDAIGEDEDSPPKRKRGRPDGAKTKKIPRKPSTVGSVRYKNYYTGHHNKAQDTQASWAWIDNLDTAEKEILDLTVYRDWPVLKMPLALPDGAKRKNPKSIAEQIPGTEAFKTDQDVVHMFGAGNYRVYLNENPPGGARRELFCNVVKATHDFRAFPPTDWRIDDINNVDLNDPSNGSYVEWLKSRGKIPDNEKDKQEKDEMSATAEVLGKVLDQNTAVMNRMLDEKDKQIADVANDPPPDPPSPKEVLNDQLTMFKTLKDLIPTSDPMEMMRQVVATAQLLVQKNGNADMKPLMDQIDKLREESRTTERQMWQSQLADIKERLAAKDNPSPTVLASDGANLEGIVQRVVEKFMDKPEENPWLDIFKQAIPIVGPAINMFVARMMTSTPPQAPPAFPMPPTSFQAGAPQQPQAQLPAPTQPPQPAPQAQPQATAEQTEVERILTAISAPVIDALSEGRDGDDFADYVREEFGAQAQRLLAKFQEQEILAALYVFPLIAPRMAQFPQDRVAKFVHEFKEYDRDKYDAKMDAKGGAA